jgi:hypothetical protein
MPIFDLPLLVPGATAVGRCAFSLHDKKPPKAAFLHICH